MSDIQNHGSPRSELGAALKSCRSAVVAIALISAVVNVLYLTGSFFMLEVYDRVLPSRSVPTLVALAILASALYAFQGLLEIVRGRILSRVGAFLDETVSARVYNIVVGLPLRTSASQGVQPLRDLEQIRSFFASGGPSAFFDLPWLPLYIIICFMFHFWIGVAAAVGALLLIAITILTEIMTRRPAEEAIAHGTMRYGLADACRRNAEVVQAMGMGSSMEARWQAANAKYLQSQLRAADIAGGLGGLSKAFRMALQSAVLGVGAYLVIQQQASAGIIIAASIISARALAPVELAIANWKGFYAARQGWARLAELFAAFPPDAPVLKLPTPSKSIGLEGVSLAPPGSRRLVVQDVGFALHAGQGLGVLGPSGSGKSTLVRAIVGIWRPVRGDVRIDGASLSHWGEHLGGHIGYLPQDVELFAGSIAQNIARFRPSATSMDVIAAARAAGVHELILRLPEGYETMIGESGAGLSAGQRQRIGLARALFGNPFLVVLDEPNSNLDSEGEAALTTAIRGVRARNGIVVVVAHRPSALAGVDQVLMMSDGRKIAFGPKDDVLAQFTQLQDPAARRPASGGLRVIGAPSPTRPDLTRSGGVGR